MKVASIVGARPNFIKLAPISRELARRNIEHIIIHTGQHYDYELSQIFFEKMALPNPDYNLEVGSGTQGEQLGEIIKRCERILLRERPEIVIVYGDTNSTLGGALASSKNHIPVAHVEAGLRSFNVRMQEEINRIVTDHISAYLFCPTRTAIKNLERECLGNRAYMTGDVMVETINIFLPYLDRKVITLYGVNEREYALLTLHRAENVDSVQNLSILVDAICEVSETLKVVFPIHPRTFKALKTFNLMHKMQSKNIKLIQPLGYIDFLTLEKYAKIILTDSGGVQKEAYILGIPCITLREETEWCETVEGGWNILVGLNRDAIVKSALNFAPSRRRANIFGDGTASKIICNILTEGE